MDKNALEKVCKNIYKRFPNLKDKNPKVSKQTADRYLLLFSSSGTTPDGKTIKQVLRVVASEEGKIIKTSVSR